MNTDAAYVAGVFDADGTIGVYTHQEKICIGMQDRELLDWIQSIWGGKIYLNGRVWSWQVLKRDERVKFLTDILPYSRTKKQQVFLLLGFLTYQPVGCDLINRFKVLNKAHSLAGPWNEDKEPSTDGKGGE